MDADAGFRMVDPDEARDQGAPVAALRDVGAVAEGQHQLVEHGGDLLGRESGVLGGGGKAEAGEGRCDDVERLVFRRGGFGEEREDIFDLEEGAGPAVDEEQWDGVLTGRAVVDEMKTQVFALGGDGERELLESGIQTGLNRAPVVLTGPEFLQGGEGLDRQAVGPAAAFLVVERGRQTAGADAVIDKGEKVVGHGDSEGGGGWKRH